EHKPWEGAVDTLAGVVIHESDLMDHDERRVNPNLLSSR
ncbi:MAG: hypothetical protein QOJ15_1366, partial [Bradyrhizobium sp.]|nr:hypothetical protein [Bradyrhizobium sp.]